MKKFTNRLIAFIPFMMLALVFVANPAFASGASIPQITAPKVDGQVSTMVGTILGYIQYAGIVIGVGTLIFVGIKYMQATGDQKGEIKNLAINYIIGAFLIFGAAAILEVVKNLVTGSGIIK